jgi:hypothetical protein
MVDFYEYSTPELVRLLGNRFKEFVAISLRKMFLSNPELDLQPSTNSRMVQLAIFHCQHLLCC